MYPRLFFLLLLPLFFWLSAEASEAKVTLSFYDDSARDYNMSEVIAKEKHLFTQSLASPHLKFAADTHTFLKLHLKNNTDKSVRKVVAFYDIRLDKMEVYSKSGEKRYEVGDMVPYLNRPFEGAGIAIALEAEANSEETLFVLFTNSDRSDLSYRVYDEAVFLDAVILKKMLHAFFFGALLIMFIYNMVLYLFIRERAFLVYIIYHAVLMIVMLYYNGYVSQYWHPDAYGVNGGNVPGVLIFLSVILAIEFLRSFLYTKAFTPRLDLALRVFLFLNIVLMLFSPWDVLPKQAAIVVMMPLSLYLMFVSGYHAFVLKRKLAFFYLIGWIVMLVAIIVTGLLSLGLLERNGIIVNIFQLGIVIEITLLSMGLAYRYKINQEALAESNRLIQEQAKLASMGELLRHISHQWRQPLSEINAVAMKIETEYRRETLDAKKLDENIDAIETITEHMSKTIQDFNSYFRSDKQRITVMPEQVIKKSLNLVQSSLKQHGIEIDIAVETTHTIKVVEGELVQVVLVLLNNARDAIVSKECEEKWIKVLVREVDAKVLILVEDSGGGIAKENLSKVFEPYFTTKFEAQGTGIGLYMSKMIVEESLGGSLTVQNGLNGAKFSIVL